VELGRVLGMERQERQERRIENGCLGRNQACRDRRRVRDNRLYSGTSGVLAVEVAAPSRIPHVKLLPAPQFLPFPLTSCPRLPSGQPHLG
jgi:hypothetical protein